MKEIIKKIILENQNLSPKIFDREFEFPQTQKIITLIGPRRVGKSYLFYKKIQDLREKYNKENIIYINFDDERLLPLQTSDLNEILESYHELYPEKLNEKVFLFFDEIQNIDNWELFIRRIYDKEKYNIYITGSSSKLLSKEIATSLRGRTLSFYIFPLNFREFLSFKKIELEKNFEYSDQRFEIKKLFQEYLTYGGFPEITREELKIEILQNYIDLTIYKDLIERFNIRNMILLKNMIKYLATNAGKEFSVNSYYNLIKNDLKVSRETIIEYMGYLEDINFLFFLPKFNYSLKKQQASSKKIYLVDNGFINSVAFRFSEDYGRLLENLVYITLKQKHEEIFYHQDGSECDFVVKEGLDITCAIQVTKNLNEKQTREREITGLINAMKTYNLKEGLVLTEDSKEEITQEGFKIKVLPIWLWLLQS